MSFPTQFTPRRKTRSEFNPRWIILGSVVIIALALAAIYVTRDTSGEVGASSAKRPAPDFTLAGLDGQVSLTDFRGNVVLLNFWASWCPPCLEEMPALNAYYQDHRNDGFTLLAVNVDEDPATVQSFLQANGFDFPVALDMVGAVYERYGGAGLPSSFLIGPDGSLVKVWRPGAITRSMLDEDVTPLLKG